MIMINYGDHYGLCRCGRQLQSSKNCEEWQAKPFGEYRGLQLWSC